MQSILVIAISALALGIAMLVAMFYARRITQPLEDFAEMAGRIATGDRRQLGRRYGVPELDAVAEVLDQGLSAFNDLLENERRVTTEASHQLRTPLTALSLRLEEILATDDLDVVHTEATAALGQVERLSGVVDEVVGVSRGTRVSVDEPFDVDELIASQITEWTPAFQAAGRRLVRVGRDRARGGGARRSPRRRRSRPSSRTRSCTARARTTIRLRASGTWVVIEVSDDGPGVPAGARHHGVRAARQRHGLVRARPRAGAHARGGRRGTPGDDDGATGGVRDVPPGADRGGRAPVSGTSTADGADVETSPVRAQAEEEQATQRGQTVVASVSSPAASVSSGNTQRR